MSKLLFLIGVICLVNTKVRADSIGDMGSTTGLSNEVKTELLKLHNSIRSDDALNNPGGAADMMQMVWSDTLAATAQAWADKCLVDQAHDGNADRIPGTSFDYVGQNVQRVYAGTKDAAKLGIKQYMDEKPWYKFDSNTCDAGKQCGHYTQIIWAKSFYLGCGYNNNCPNQGIGKIVCNYGPAGNIVGQKPYTPGAACSACPLNALFCLKGLCTSKENCPDSGCTCTIDAGKCSANGGTMVASDCVCKCPAGKAGPVCEKDCANSYPDANCDWYKSNNYCAHPLLAGKCDKACGTCDTSVYTKPINQALKSQSLYSAAEWKAAVAM